jgi:hypothetical protein
VVLYGSERWTLKKERMGTMETAEMRFLGAVAGYRTTGHILVGNGLRIIHINKITRKLSKDAARTWDCLNTERRKQLDSHSDVRGSNRGQSTGWSLFFCGFSESCTNAGGSDKGRKVKLSLCLTKHHAIKGYWRSGGISPRILWPRH